MRVGFNARSPCLVVPAHRSSAGHRWLRSAVFCPDCGDGLGTEHTRQLTLERLSSVIGSIREWAPA